MQSAAREVRAARTEEVGVVLVPILLAVMLAILLVHGYVVRRRTSNHDHGVFFDVGASHNQTFANSLQDFAPTPHARGFDTKHWTSVYWG